jgi:hypothetical protein
MAGVLAVACAGSVPPRGVRVLGFGVGRMVMMLVCVVGVAVLVLHWNTSFR